MRAAELEGRELSPKERRLWVASAETRCWVCGLTIYRSTGIPDGERQYCSRACAHRAEDLRARYPSSGQAREKSAVAVRGHHTEGQLKFAASVVQLSAQQQRLRKFFFIPLVLFFSLPLVLWVARAARFSRGSVELVLLGCLLLALLVSFWAARKVGKLEDEYGLKCPECKRYFRGRHLLHVLKTGECMLCGATVFPI